MITKDKAVELIERAVTERGADYVDPGSLGGFGCKYLDGDVPGCIVGTALGLAGATTEQLGAMDRHGGGGYYSSMSYLIDSGNLSTLPVETTEAAAEVFLAAQQQQDSGTTWGEALEVARKRAEELGAAE
jgi:hypothetical protein